MRIASGEEVPKPIDRKKNLYFLQVADLSGQTLRYIPIPKYDMQTVILNRADDKNV